MCLNASQYSNKNKISTCQIFIFNVFKQDACVLFLGRTSDGVGRATHGSESQKGF